MKGKLVDVDINIVKELAVAGGKAIMKIYKDDSIDWNVEKKADNSPLTIADKAANKVICDGLIKHYPEMPILSEENKMQDFEERKNWNLFWLVDPLDGTKEFIKKNGEFTVNIALVQKGRPISGVVYVPATEELFFAEKEKGAFKTTYDGTTTSLKTKKYGKGEKGVKVVCSRSHMSEETEMFVSQFDEPEMLSKGSSLKFMLVAEGLAHVYPRIAPTMEWDTGAAQIIVEEAGGKVLQYQTNEAVVYNKENLLNPFFEVYG